MDSARKAVSSFLSKDGKHDTTVHETINPAVQHENVTRTQHENQTTAIDREVHQDHHHTSVQPVKDREVLPEQHTHQMGSVEHRNIKHGNDEHVKERLAKEQAQFKDTQTIGDVQHSSSAKPTLAGEHIHHHVHENIQPVIQKETIQPSVVHTTIPVHEVHQNEAKHHSATQLPAVSMSDFKNKGGSLSGRETRTDAFQGEPKSVGGTLGGHGAHGTTSLTEKEGHGHSSTHTHSSGMDSKTHGNTTAGPHSSDLKNKMDPRVDSDMSKSAHNTYDNADTSKSHNTHSSNTHSNMNDLQKTQEKGMAGVGSGRSSANYTTGPGNLNQNQMGSAAAPRSAVGGATATPHQEPMKKPSLLDKINPLTDADGDGKKGFMK